MYSASIVNNLKINYLLLIQLSTPPNNLKTYPLVDHLWSRSLAQSKSRAMYINFPIDFRFPLVIDCKICCSTQVPKLSFDSILVLLSRHSHVIDQYLYYMGNNQLMIDHCIHQDTYNTSIGNIYHVIYFFLCLGTPFSR